MKQQRQWEQYQRQVAEMKAQLAQKSEQDTLYGERKKYWAAFKAKVAA